MKALTILLCVSSLLLGVSRLRADAKPEQVPALIKVLKQGNAKARASAADDLGQIGAVHAADAKEALPILFGLLKTEGTASVRKSIVTALGKMDPDPKEAVPAFVAALNAPPLVADGRDPHGNM